MNLNQKAPPDGKKPDRKKSNFSKVIFTCLLFICLTVFKINPAIGILILAAIKFCTE